MELLTSTLLYQWLAARISDLWLSPTGQIFIVTVFFYVLAYLIYGGYLSKFAGGFGGIPFSLIELSVIDLITLFPTAAFTFLTILANGGKKLAKAALTNLIGPLILAAVIGTWYKVNFLKIELSVPETSFAIIGQILWFVGFFLPILIPEPKQAKTRRIFMFIWLALQISGMALMALGASITTKSPNATNSVVSNSGVSLSVPPNPALGNSATFNPVIEAIAFLFLFIFIPIIPVIFGSRMAEEAVREKILSKVSRAVFKQPLPGLGEMQPGKINFEQITTWKNHWFVRSSLPVAIEPDTYICVAEAPLYLVASFRNVAAFYVPEKDQEQMNGRLVVVARDLIYSIELELSKPKKNQQLA